MNHYLVVSPEMSEIVSLLDDGSGPREYFHCVCSVAAKTQREAKIKAIKHPDMKKWVEEQRDNDCNPFTGLTVESPLCPHGICFCDMCEGECAECDKE